MSRSASTIRQQSRRRNYERRKWEIASPERIKLSGHGYEWEMTVTIADGKLTMKGKSNAGVEMTARKSL